AGRPQRESHVDQHDPALVLEDRHVLADLPQPTEWENAQRAAQTALSNPRCSRTPRITACSSALQGTSGKRTPPTSWPSMLSPALLVLDSWVIVNASISWR